MAILFSGLLEMAVVVFLVIVFAEYGNIRKKAKKGFNLLAGSGLFFLLAHTFSTLSVWGEVNSAIYGTYLFEIIGWVFIIVGTVWASYQLAQK